MGSSAANRPTVSGAVVHCPVESFLALCRRRAAERLIASRGMSISVEDLIVEASRLRVPASELLRSSGALVGDLGRVEEFSGAHADCLGDHN